MVVARATWIERKWTDNLDGSRDKQLGDTTDIDAPLAWLYTPSYSVCRVWLDPSSLLIPLESRSAPADFPVDVRMMSFHLFFFLFSLLIICSWPPDLSLFFFSVAIRQRMRREQATRRPLQWNGRAFFTAAHKSFFSFFPSSPFFDSREVNALPALAQGGILHVYLFLFLDSGSWTGNSIIARTNLSCREFFFFISLYFLG